MLLRFVYINQPSNDIGAVTSHKDSIENALGKVWCKTVFYDPESEAYWWDTEYPCLPPVGALITVPDSAIELCPRVCDYHFDADGTVEVFAIDGLPSFGQTLKSQKLQVGKTG